ncbi:MAG: DUF6036 family nucleotidyltransferase, partial [Pyrinomonadaceae bacterium]
MREIATKEKIEEFMRAFGRAARSESRVYFTGGTTAVLLGWRDSTIDIDLRFEPELDELFRALPKLKEKLQINVELAAPSDFIPPLSGWQTRCRYIGREGKVSFYHYDTYSQALSKIERGHKQDKSDVEAMIKNGLVDRRKLFDLFQKIKPQLYKYPAIDPEN